MEITTGKIIVWLIVGALVGSLMGRIVKRRRRGFGLYQNIFIGTLGAVIGGILFDLFDITIGGEIVVTSTDFIAAFIGAIIVLMIIWFLGRR